MQRASAVFLAAILSGLALGQPGDPKPAFEIADVHVSAPARFPFMRGPSIRRGRYELRVATMVDLVSKAYGIEEERILGGPSWVENDRFDIIANAPAATTVETAQPMLQSLLAQRFSLIVHNDKKPIPAYALKAGKHAQMKESDGSGETGCKFIQPPATASGGLPPMTVFTFSCHNMTMEAFAAAMRTSIFFAPQYLGERIVVDESELKGAWDFDLKFSPKGGFGPTAATETRVTLFDAVEKLGLKLETVNVPMPVIVIDRVNETPTPNAPNMAETLHTVPAPTEFDVATVKPTDPTFQGMNLQIQPGGRVNLRGVTLKFLIEQAWDLSDEMLAGDPKWLGADRFDIVAKANVPGPEMDVDDLWPMLKALMKERFKLAVHTEERPVEAYALISKKPKLKKSDADSRTKYKEGPATEGRDPRDKNPILGRLVTCQNMTMAQFAEKLKSIAPGYIHSPVLDATGLEGGYDFTLSFSPAGLTRNLGGGGGRGGAQPAAPSDAGDTAPSASDPNGAITLFEAIEQQLGLKLEARKRPVPVLVIDHVEQKPVEN